MVWGAMEGRRPRASSAYNRAAIPSCLKLLRQWVLIAFCRAAPRVGINNEPRMVSIAITTRSSTKVNALGRVSLLVASLRALGVISLAG